MDRWIRGLFRIDDADEMRRQAKALLDLVRRHLAREEEVMFTAARQALSAGALAECGEEWARFRGMTLGPAAASTAS
jgi:hemerythrin-like domain-containing protein